MANQITKYSILDDESNLIVGTCDEIFGMTGECTVTLENELLHKIILKNFQITESIKNHCKKTKSYVSNIYLRIMDVTGNPIGSYFFSSIAPLYFHKREYVDKLNNLELIGKLRQGASKEALEIWESWRQALPASINLWSGFSVEQREGWLEVVRKHFNITSKDERNGTYILDATYVTDSTSFFCAIGEAINGPGAYFGLDFMTLRDCLCGGFGAVPPFTIHVQNTNDFWAGDNDFLEQVIKILSDRHVNLVRL